MWKNFMKKSNFLKDLNKERKLELVDSSEDICNSYLGKSNDCLGSAKLLLQNDFYENSVTMSYYAMYNSLLALFFKCGIKSENHSASVVIFKEVFNKTDLHNIISWAKKERIDKQYYIISDEDKALTKESASEMLMKAEKFTVGIKTLIKGLKNEDIQEIRKKFSKIVK